MEKCISVSSLVNLTLPQSVCLGSGPWRGSREEALHPPVGLSDLPLLFPGHLNIRRTQQWVLSLDEGHLHLYSFSVMGWVVRPSSWKMRGIRMKGGGVAAGERSGAPPLELEFY